MLKLSPYWKDVYIRIVTGYYDTVRAAYLERTGPEDLRKALNRRREATNNQDVQIVYEKLVKKTVQRPQSRSRSPLRQKLTQSSQPLEKTVVNSSKPSSSSLSSFSSPNLVVTKLVGIVKPQRRPHS